MEGGKKIRLTDFEFNRQMFHIFLGLTLVLLLRYGFIGHKFILILIIIGIILSYLSKKYDIPVIRDLLQKFERKEDLEKFPGKGIIFYLMGAYVSLVIFPKDIVMASIMILAFGDSVSHMFGLHYGKTKHPLSKTKFVEGTIAGFIAGFLGALIFLPFFEAFLSSLAAMIVEGVEIKIRAEQVDDNLIIPLVAGSVAWLVRLL